MASMRKLRILRTYVEELPKALQEAKTCLSMDHVDPKKLDHMLRKSGALKKCILKIEEIEKDLENIPESGVKISEVLDPSIPLMVEAELILGEMEGPLSYFKEYAAKIDEPVPTSNPADGDHIPSNLEEVLTSKLSAKLEEVLQTLNSHIVKLDQNSY